MFGFGTENIFSFVIIGRKKQSVFHIICRHSKKTEYVKKSQGEMRTSATFRNPFESIVKIGILSS